MKVNSHIFDKDDCLTDELKHAYIAGKLGGRNLHKVEKHLLLCEMCADEIDGLKLLGVEETSRIANEVNSRILEISNPQNKKTITLKRIFAYAALLLLLIGFGALIKMFFEPKVVINQISQNEEMSIPSPEIAENKDATTDELAFIEKSAEIKDHDIHQKTVSALAGESEESSPKAEEILAKIETPSNKELTDDITSVNEELEKPAPEIYESESMIVEDKATVPQSAKKESIMVQEEQKREDKKSKSRSSSPTQSAVYDQTNETTFPSEQNLTTQVRQEFVAKEYHSVISLLSSLNKNYPDFFEMQWLLAKSYNELNEKEKCENVLQEIVNSESPYKGEAQRLWEKIK